MFRSFITASVLAFAITAPAIAADTYVFDPTHAAVELRYTHMGFSRQSIKLVPSAGEVTIDEADLSKSSVNVTFDMTKANSGYAIFDEHLAGEGLFDSKKYPTATFKSTKVDVTGADTAKVTGDLTIKGITKPVTLDVKLNKKGAHPFSQKPTVGFSATTQIKRSEFNAGAAVPAVSDEVDISIEIEASAQ